MNPDTKMFEEMDAQKKQDVLKELFTGSAVKDEKKLADIGWKCFAEYEIVEIKGIEFYVRKVTKKDLILRPVGQRSDSPIPQH